MIRQWFIMSVLAALTVAVLWNFITEAALYDPLKEIEGTESEGPGRVISKADFQPAWGTEIQDKNLFSAQRSSTPPPPKPTATATPSAEEAKPKAMMPELELSGIIVNQYGEYVAYIKRDNKDIIPLMKGDEFEEIRVLNIDDRSVKLAWRDEQIELFLAKIETLTR